MVSSITASRPVCLEGQFKCDLRGGGESSKAGNGCKGNDAEISLALYSDMRVSMLHLFLCRYPLLLHVLAFHFVPSVFSHIEQPILMFYGALS